MLVREAVERESGHPVECSRRLLSAIRRGNWQDLRCEVARVSTLSGLPRSRESRCSLIEEQTELLGAIVDSMHVSTLGYEPCAEADLFLLGHLAGAIAVARPGSRLRATAF